MNTEQTSTRSAPRLALLIDAENTYHAHAMQIMSRVFAMGRPTVLRAYGDWMTTQLLPWKKVVQKFAIRPVPQFHHRKGKNASDAVLIMDTMELLHAGNVEGICIASSDSDFTSLAARIREAGLLAYGFGRRDTVPTFAAACDVFVFLD